VDADASAHPQNAMPLARPQPDDSDGMKATVVVADEDAIRKLIEHALPTWQSSVRPKNSDPT